MNEHDPLNEALASLREVSPPTSVRQRNQAAIASALEQRIRKGWWRQKISMPLPVALAVAALLFVSLSLHVLDEIKTKLPTGPNETPQREVSEPPALSQYAVSNSPRVRYTESQRYVSGIGVINRIIVRQIEE